MTVVMTQRCIVPYIGYELWRASQWLPVDHVGGSSQSVYEYNTVQ